MNTTMTEAELTWLLVRLILLGIGWIVLCVGGATLLARMLNRRTVG